MPAWFDHVLVLAACVAFPLYGYLTYASFVRDVRAGVPGARRRAYLETLVIQWALTLAVLAAWWWAARPAAELGLALPWTWRLAVAAAITVAALFFLGRQLTAVFRGLPADQLAQLHGQMEPVAELLPRTRGERDLFVSVALTAGICEEVLYRGFLIWYLDAWLPAWLAVAVAVAVFGAAHLYQGAPSALKCATVGAIGALLYVGSGSLLPPILLHIAVDVHGGLIGHRVMSDGVPQPAPPEPGSAG